MNVFATGFLLSKIMDSSDDFLLTPLTRQVQLQLKRLFLRMFRSHPVQVAQAQELLHVHNENSC